MGAKCRWPFGGSRMTWILRILNLKPKENKEPKSFVNTSTTRKQTLETLRTKISNTKISCRVKRKFHFSRSPSLTDTQNENEDFGCRRGGHSAHSTHVGRGGLLWP